MPGVKTGSSTTTHKQKVPKVIHPLATPGYIIILNFISACVFNILVFVISYAFIIIAIPISLLVKFVQKVAVFVRMKTQGVMAETGNAGETFWFLTAREDQKPYLIVLLAVKGRVTSERLEYLVQKRLNCHSEEENERRVHYQRLSRTAKQIFHELVWLDNDTHCKRVRQIDMDTACLFPNERNVINLETFSNEWEVYLYTSNENESDNVVILLEFQHCIADIYTLLYAISRSFLDRQTYVFHDEISPTQTFCLGLIALFAGPSIFFRNLLISKDVTFAEPPSPAGQKRAIYYSGAVSKSDVETVTTATGTSATDVILSCLAGSLRSCLKQHGVLFPDDVTVYYPMNLESSHSLRCYTSFNVFSLPVGTEGAIPRLWEMRLRRNNISSFVEAITTSTVVQLAFLILPPSLATRLVGYLLNKCSCTLTSVLGHSLEDDFFLDGRSVENFIPIEDSGHGISITIIECKDTYQMAVLAPSTPDYLIKPAQLCAEFVHHTRVLSARLIERARVVRARGQKILNSRRNSVFIVEEDEQ